MEKICCIQQLNFLPSIYKFLILNLQLFQQFFLINNTFNLKLKKKIKHARYAQILIFLYLWVTSPMKCKWFSQKLKKGQKINKSFINIEQKMDHFQCVTTWKLVDRLGNFFLPTLCLIPSYNYSYNTNIYPLTNLSTTRQKYEILAKKLEVSEKKCHNSVTI